MRTVPTSRRLALTIACVGLVGGLTACGAGGSDGEAQGSGPFSGPLNDLLGSNYDPAESRANDLKQQELVAVCMKDAGYEYIPVDYQAMQPEGADDLQWTDPIAFGKKYGYGVVYSYNLYEKPYLSGDGVEPVDQGFEDPNWEYQQTLSEAEQMEYQTALYGEQTFAESEGEFTEETVYVAPPLEDQGCYGKAQKEVYGTSPWENPDIAARLDEVFQDMSSDPRIEDGNLAWSDCMYELDGNWDFLSPDETYQYFEGAKSRLQGQRRVELDPETGEPFEPLPDGEYVNWSTVNPDGTSYGYVGEQKLISDADLDELQKEEIDMWAADQDCQKDAGLEKIRKEVEQEIVDDLTAQFPELDKKDEG